MEAESVGACNYRPLLFKWCLLSLLVPATAGCHLGQERETLVLAFPPGRDEVRLLLIYEGFHAITGGNKNLKTVLESAKQDLSGLMASEQQFRLDGWPLHFDLAPQEGESEAQKEFREFLRTHLKIQKGAFFSDQAGRLNGYQFLTIRDPQKFTAEINDRLSAHLAEQIPETLGQPEPTWELFDKESLELILKAAREKHHWLELKPGRLSFTLPGTEAAFERCKREVLQFPELEKLRKEAANREKADEHAALNSMREAIGSMERNAEWLSQLPLSFDLRKDRMIVSLGFGAGEPIILKTPNESQEKRSFEKELTAHARTLDVPFRDEVTVESLIEEFLEEVGPHPEKEGAVAGLWHFLSRPAFVGGLATGILIGWLAAFLRNTRKRHGKLAASGK